MKINLSPQPSQSKLIALSLSSIIYMYSVVCDYYTVNRLSITHTKGSDNCVATYTKGLSTEHSSSKNYTVYIETYIV